MRLPPRVPATRPVSPSHPRRDGCATIVANRGRYLFKASSRRTSRAPGSPRFWRANHTIVNASALGFQLLLAPRSSRAWVSYRHCVSCRRCSCSARRRVAVAGGLVAGTAREGDRRHDAPLARPRGPRDPLPAPHRCDPGALQGAHDEPRPARRSGARVRRDPLRERDRATTPRDRGWARGPERRVASRRSRASGATTSATSASNSARSARANRVRCPRSTCARSKCCSEHSPRPTTPRWSPHSTCSRPTASATSSRLCSSSIPRAWSRCAPSRCSPDSPARRCSASSTACSITTTATCAPPCCSCALPRAG